MNVIVTNARRLALAFVLGPLAWSAAPAQEAPSPTWLDVVVVQVKGGMALDFEDRVRELSAARAEAGLPPMLIANVVSGHPNEYHLVTEAPSLEAANEPEQLMPPGRFATWFGRISATVDSVRFFYAMTYPEHAIAQEQGQGAELLLLRKTRVISGKQAEYLEWLESEYMPAFRQTNPLGHTLSQGILGDTDQHFYHAVPMANWAALDQGDPVAALLGERRMTDMIDNIDDIVEYSELMVLQVRPDLMGIPQE